MTPSTVTVDNKVMTKSEQENANELPNKLRKETGVGDLSEVMDYCCLGVLTVHLLVHKGNREHAQVSKFDSQWRQLGSFSK